MVGQEGRTPPAESALLRGRETAVRLKASSGDGTETVWFKLDLNAIAELEESYGGWQQINDAMESKPVRVIRDIVARCVLRCSPEEAGERMLPEETTRYFAAMQAALSLAYGAEEEQAGKVIAVRLALMAEIGHQGLAALEAGLDRIAGPSPGSNGTRRGAARGGRSRSSGG